LPVGAIYLAAMCALAVYLARVRVYDEVASKQPVNGFTLVESTFMNRRRVVEVLVDASLIGASYYVATQLVFSDPEGYLRNAEVFYRSLPVIVITQLVAFFGRGLYRGIWQPFGRRDVNKVLEAVLAGTLIAQVFLTAYYGYIAVSWKVTLLQAVLLSASVILTRLIGRMFPP
jgi:FlaA1/EpsC-like NDP-sugar epimerase